MREEFRNAAVLVAIVVSFGAVERFRGAYALWTHCEKSEARTQTRLILDGSRNWDYNCPGLWAFIRDLDIYPSPYKAGRPLGPQLDAP